MAHWKRRDCLKLAVAGSGLTALTAPGINDLFGQTADETKRSNRDVRIEDVKAILTAPARIRLVVVKIQTNQPGLYGLGCATFTQRARAVETAVDHFLKPFLVGKPVSRIEETWNSIYLSSYWRNGPVLNNALSGVDMALWDILGKLANQPVYQLFGGKARDAVDTYRHASGSTFEEVEENVRRYMDQGYRYVRAQVGLPGLSNYGSKSDAGNAATATIAPNAKPEVFEPGPYVRAVPRLFEHLRDKLGDEVELLHDVHERVPPILAIKLAKDVEPLRLFFLEDPFSPEDVGYFKTLRQQTATPIAMGELFNNPNEYVEIIANRWIDFIRIHISQIGGLTPARKLANMCEFFRVRTAWHGPGDVSPVGHAANVHLDMATQNFGIQEAREFTPQEQEVFPGCPTLKDGYYHLNELPGLGIDIDEALAARFPINDDPPFDMNWGNLRRRDGEITKP